MARDGPLVCHIGGVTGRVSGGPVTSRHGARVDRIPDVRTPTARAVCARRSHTARVGEMRLPLRVAYAVAKDYRSSGVGVVVTVTTFSKSRATNE